MRLHTLIESIRSSSIFFFSWFILEGKDPRASLDCSPLDFCEYINKKYLIKKKLSNNNDQITW